MKWKLLLLIAILIFIFSLRSFLSNQAEKLDGKVLFDPKPTNKERLEQKKSTYRPPRTSKPIPPSLSREDKKRLQQEKQRRRAQEGYTGLDSKELAVTDPQGNIYPEQILVDGENLISYGDIIVGERRFIEDYEKGEKALVIPKPKPWPRGKIPYSLEDKLTDIQKKIFKEIAKDLKEKTGVQLVEADLYKDKDYLLVSQGGDNCYANVGYNTGVSKMSLSPQCDRPAIYHEIFHVLGFFHEQNRFDRDDHLKILWENIKDGFSEQFEKFAERSFPDALRDSTFSFDSFMLYRATSFSETRDYTMVTVYGEPYEVKKEPTKLDFDRVKKLYENELN